MIGTTTIDGKLPTGYEPYGEVNFCSNKLSNVDFIIEIDGNLPILIGRGISPLVWISAPTDVSRNTWSYVVEANRKRHPDFKIDVDGRTVTVSAGSNIILKVVATGANTASVTQVNLEPVGLRVKGDTQGLTVGTSRLQGNMVSGGRVFLGLSG